MSREISYNDGLPEQAERPVRLGLDVDRTFAVSDPEGAKLEAELSEAVNQLGIGPQGLGGRSTSFRVHVEVAATHITMNPVAVNIQCHSARRANAVITPGGIDFK